MDTSPIPIKKEVPSQQGEGVAVFLLTFVSLGIIFLYCFVPSTFETVFAVVPESFPGYGIAFIAFSIVVFAPAIFSVRLFIHARKTSRITARLVEARDRYARALEGSGAGTWERDVTSGTIYVSERWKALFEYDEHTAPRTHDAWLAMVVDEDRRAADEAYQHAVKTNMRFYKSSYRIKTGHGAIRYVVDEGAIERRSSGKTIVSGSTRDVTAMHDAEELLKKRTEELRLANERIQDEIVNTRKFALAVAAAGDGIVITDTAGTILYANAAWRTLVGGGEAAPEGRKIFEYFENASSPDDIRTMRAVLRSGGTYVSDTLRGVRNGIEFFDVEFSLFPVKEAEQTLFYSAIAIDATKRKAIERAKSEFVSIASHQLKTPLAAIKWYTEMLLGEVNNTPDAPVFLHAKEIERANERMIDLVDSLLDVSHIELGTMIWKPEPMRISGIVIDVLRELRSLVETKHISVSTDIHGDEPEILFDRHQLSIVFQNLLSNAAKYVSEGGHIEVLVRPEQDAVFFSIKDNGCGIPITEQSRIFSKMFRAENARSIDPSGTGLGLYIVKQIIERAGGSIRFDSEEGTGTVFYGILPIRPKGTLQS